MTRGLSFAILAGVLVGVGAWYAFSRPVATSGGAHASRGGVQPTDPGSSIAPAARREPGVQGGDRPRASAAARRVVSESAASPTKIVWDEVRDAAWAEPMEQALGAIGEGRLARLLPEAEFRAVACRTSICTFEIACRPDDVELCHQVASVLVLVDGMTLRVREQGTDAEGWVPVHVDVSLPPGGVEGIRSAIAAELAAHPDVTERIASRTGPLHPRRWHLA